eukprot:TRINITY_DN8854_c0_g1_i1.p1 TRINITY_DN8854_c0_g1~~TRINITY_DN8854_c0_g1_i1.p1  ORF type:complete len:611 (-),score=93.87 TRINITY_DN8854_c0_g1_i1:126-1772(-)
MDDANEKFRPSKRTKVATGADSAGLAEPSGIFLDQDGKPMQFFIRDIPDKPRIAQLVNEYGGTVRFVHTPAATIIVDPAQPTPPGNYQFYSMDFVDKCVEAQRLLPLEQFRVEPRRAAESASVGATTKGRTKFTAEEDEIIKQAVQQAQRDGITIGNNFWKELEQQRLPSHSWDSTKSHYTKSLFRKENSRRLLNNRSTPRLDLAPDSPSQPESALPTPTTSSSSSPARQPAPAASSPSLAAGLSRPTPVDDDADAAPPSPARAAARPSGSVATVVAAPRTPSGTPTKIRGASRDARPAATVAAADGKPASRDEVKLDNDADTSPDERRTLLQHAKPRTRSEVKSLGAQRPAASAEPTTSKRSDPTPSASSVSEPVTVAEPPPPAASRRSVGQPELAASTPQPPIQPPLADLAIPVINLEDETDELIVMVEDITEPEIIDPVQGNTDSQTHHPVVPNPAPVNSASTADSTASAGSIPAPAVGQKRALTDRERALSLTIDQWAEKFGVSTTIVTYAIMVSNGDMRDAYRWLAFRCPTQANTQPVPDGSA